MSNTGEVSKRKGNLGPMPPREVQPHTIGTPMRITNLKLHSDDYHNVLSATVGDFDLWFRFGRDETIRESVDPFVAAALLPAMLYGTDIEVEGAYAVSEPLLNNLAELQEVFSCWSKLFRVVRIHCMTSPVAPARNRVGTFFSGGLDSHFTFLRHRDSVTNLIVINGFDFEMPPEVFSKVLARVDDFGKACGVTTTPVETNFLAYERHHKLLHTTTFGSCLGMIILALEYARVYIPSSHTYRELSAEGSHPLTDRFWSNGATQIIHDGAGHGRVDKIRACAHEQQILDSLMVCWNNPNENCGHCSKCLRTMVTLRLLHLSSKSVPRMESGKSLRGMHVTQRIDLEFVQENLDLAKDRGDKDLIRRLSAIIRNFYVREFMIDFDRVVLSGALLKLYRYSRSHKDRTGFSTR